MKSKNFLMLIISIFFFQIVSCNELPPQPQLVRQKTQLIANPSFEEFGIPTLKEWSCPEAPLLKIQMVAPQDGGFFSIFLKSREDGAFASTKVAAIPGSHVYKFSVWSKVTNLIAQAELYYIQNDSISLRKTISIKSKRWEQYIAYDTISANKGDSLKVVLFGTLSSTPQPYTWFDLCKLEIDD